MAETERCPTCNRRDDEPKQDCMDVWHLNNWCVRIEGEMTGQQAREMLETLAGKRKPN